MVQIAISVGELLDKTTILFIKGSKIKDKDKLKKVKKELSLLIPLVSSFIENNIEVDDLYTDLFGVNTNLWIVEDKLRQLEKDEDFGNEFIQLARNVYKLNDERFSLKNKINVLTNSEISEVKCYK